MNTLSIRSAALAVPVCLCVAVPAHAAHVFTNFSLTADINSTLNGGLSGGDNGAASLPPSPHFPVVLHADAGVSLGSISPPSSPHFVADLQNDSTLNSGGVNGTLSMLYDLVTQPGISGSASATVRTIAIFSVTGAVSYDLDALFSEVAPGNFVELKNEITGDVIFGPPIGGVVDTSGVLGDGTYRLTVRMLKQAIPNGSTSVTEFADRNVGFNLALTNVPAPAASLSLVGLAAMIRRRRR